MTKQIQEIFEVCGDSVLTPLFWICEYKNGDWIRSKKVDICPVCGSRSDECADADVELVLKYADKLTEYQEDIDRLVADLIKEGPDDMEDLLEMYLDTMVDETVVSIGRDTFSNTLTRMVREGRLDLKKIDVYLIQRLFKNPFFNGE